MEKFRPNSLFLLLVIYIIHNIEEAFAMAEWTQKKVGSFHPVVTSDQFLIALSIVTIIGLVIPLVFRFYKDGKYFIFIMTSFTSILFFNAFFPHIIAAINFRNYAPGVITSVLLYIPITAYFFNKIYRSQLLTRKLFLTAVIIGPVLGFLVTAGAILIGKQF